MQPSIANICLGGVCIAATLKPKKAKMRNKNDQSRKMLYVDD